MVAGLCAAFRVRGAVRTAALRRSAAAAVVHAPHGFLHPLTTIRERQFSHTTNTRAKKKSPSSPSSSSSTSSASSAFSIPPPFADAPPAASSNASTNVFMAVSPFTVENLRAKVVTEIFSRAEGTGGVPQDITSDALEACEHLLSRFADSEPATTTSSAATPSIEVALPSTLTTMTTSPPPGEGSFIRTLFAIESPRATADLIADILRHPSVIYDNAVLHRYLLLRPPTPRAIRALQLFYARPENTDVAVPRATFMIPFRKCLRDEDVPGAYAVLDLSAASPQWLAYVRRWWLRAAGFWAIGVASTMQFAEVLMRSDLLVEGGVAHPGITQIMIAAYLVNSTILGLVACASRPGDNGGKVVWRNGIFQSQWYLRAQETRMLSQIVDMDEHRIENVAKNGGEVSERTLRELESRDRRLGDSADDAVVKEYWAKQGQGFEWVEPDIDPADEEKRVRDAEKLKTLRSGENPLAQYELEGDVDSDWIQKVLAKDDV
ncbi:uncharacterized protein V1518DRAFT_413719 [Limtongia smithiae]|uniref:uncharacterized protein n=1 Tax=Limtongia smithiae TaxID=1125753 RepID=UPI0034CECAB0